MPQLRLLVVDDDVASLEQVVEQLRQLQQAEVRAVSDPQEGARLIIREKFDGILLDLKMPVLSGFDLAKLAQGSSLNHATPVVIMTARHDEDTMPFSFSHGAAYFVLKPLDRRKLAGLLDHIHQPLYEGRRRFSRVPLDTSVTCFRGSQMLQGITWNISQGGIQVEVSGLQKGDTVRVLLTLPKPGTVIKAEGIVVWEQDERQGVHFTEMTVEDQEGLRAYIEGLSH